MKRNLFILVSLILFGISFNAKAYDFSAINAEGKIIYYNIIDTTVNNYSVEVTYNYIGNSVNNTYTDTLIIPYSVTYGTTTYFITKIGNHAFYRCYNLTSIIIPNSVNNISHYAFNFCTGLDNINLPNSILIIGYSVFSNCDNIISIDIPSSVINIYDNVFENCI